MRAELPAIAVNTENLEALLRSDASAGEPRTLGVSTEIEDTLRLIAATDEERIGLEKERTVSNGPRSSERRRSSLTAIFVAFGLILLVAGIAAFVYRDRWLPAAKSSAPVVQDNFPLQVKAEPQGNGLIDVRWNPQSPQVTQAREGRLVIQERDQQPRVVELNPEQLRIGHVSYQSSTESLEIRLEVVDASGTTAKESVLALSPKTNASPQAEPPPQPGRVEAPPIPQVAGATTPPSPIRPAARPFTPPAPVHQDTGNPVVLEPLANVPSVPTGPVSVPGTGLRQAVTGLPGPPPPQPAASQPLRVGGNIQEAKLIKKVTPIYPQAAKLARIQGTVRFEATISKTGTIRDLRVVNGPMLLIPAATEAVKQWIYRPTLLNGEPTELVTQIDVTFSLN
ncbi:MAG: TonB family protein [Bryobacteraceae bacterium]|jgi:protein TonB